MKSNQTVYEIYVTVMSQEGIKLTPNQCLYSTDDREEAKRYFNHFLKAGHQVQVRKQDTTILDEEFLKEIMKES